MAYISKIKVPGVEAAYLIKDSEGRLMIAPAFDSSKSYSAGDYYVKDGKLYVINSAGTTGIETTVSKELQSIKQSIAGAMHYIGITSTKLTDGATTTELAPLEGQLDSLTKNTNFVAGDVVLAPASDKTSTSGERYYEYVWNGTIWSEFGSTMPIGSMAYANSASGSTSITYNKPVYTGGTVSVQEYSEGTSEYIKPSSVVGSVKVGTTTSASSVSKKNKYLSTKSIKISGDSGVAITSLDNTYKKLDTTSIFGVEATTAVASKVTDGTTSIQVGAASTTNVVSGLGSTAAASGSNPFVGATVGGDECLSWIEKPLSSIPIRQAATEKISVQKVTISGVTGLATKATSATTVATGALVNSNYNVNNDNRWDKDSIVCDLYSSGDLFQRFNNQDDSYATVATGQLSDTNDGANIADAIEITPVDGLVTGLSVSNKDVLAQGGTQGDTDAIKVLTGITSTATTKDVTLTKGTDETESVDVKITVIPDKR